MFSYVKAVTAAINKAEADLRYAKEFDSEYWIKSAWLHLDDWRGEIPSHFKLIFIRNFFVSRER